MLGIAQVRHGLQAMSDLPAIIQRVRRLRGTGGSHRRPWAATRSSAPKPGADSERERKVTVMAKKKAPLTLINFVLDASGSMEVIRQATISGFNEYKNDQARRSGRALFSLTTFDTEFDVRCTASPIEEVADLSLKSYEPSGCTALYDAIGYTVHAVDKWLESAKTKPDQVLFVIMTDGEENSSREFTREKVFALIGNRKSNAGYEFVYMGANQDAYAVGATMGVGAGHSRNYGHDPAEAELAMRVVSHATMRMRDKGAAQVEQFFTPEAEEAARSEGPSR